MSKWHNKSTVIQLKDLIKNCISFWNLQFSVLMYLLILNFAYHRFPFYSLKRYLVLPDPEDPNLLLKQQLSEKV